MRKVLNVIVIIGYIWFVLMLAYNSIIPQEIKDKIPFINEYSFFFTGISTGGISTALLFVKNFVQKSENENVKTYLDLINKIEGINRVLEKQANVIQEQNKNINKLEQLKAVESEKLEELKVLNAKIVEQQQVELKSKLTNPLLDNDIKKLIEVVLGNEK